MRVVGHHTGALRRAIHALKYEGRTDVARPLGLLLAARWHHTGVPVAGLLPVPLGAARLAERGYNQAALLAHEMGCVLKLPVLTGALHRVRETRPQVGLSQEDRLTNVRGAFQASPELAGKRWLLVDDVCTTGATLSACAQALLDCGATAVYAITLTRSADTSFQTSLAHELRTLTAPLTLGSSLDLFRQSC
ncbi:MAG: ComF family protein [Ardenticatenia bacterium]|nr:ComF family protein [Ardenticatenia bacterium]